MTYALFLLQTDGGADLIVALWKALRDGWQEGGLSFVLFLFVVLIIRQWRQEVKKLEERIEERDNEWRERLKTSEARAESYLQMLFGQMRQSERATSVAERVAEKLPPGDKP